MLSFSRLALVLALLGGVAPLCRAQDSPSLIGTRLPDPNGFDKLFDAVEKLSQADIIPSDLERLSQAEAIQQKRNVVSRNKRALFSLREALKLPIQHPPVLTSEDDFGNYNGFRTLADVLDQESAVRDLDRNWVGAMESKLDCIELGVLMTRGGPLRAAIAGRDIEIVGRRNIDKLVAHLDNDQSAAAAARLTRIESLRPPFADALRSGKLAATTLTQRAFGELEWDDVVAQTLKTDGQHFSEDERATLKNIGENEILGAIDSSFDAALATADAPYQPRSATFNPDLDPWSKQLVGSANSPSLRVDYEAARAQNRLLVLALSLRVSRVKSGRYPESFETAPDPFANGAPLKYRREGDSYVLYSVGPDTGDNGGTALSIPQNGHVPLDAKGDLLALVLPL